MENEKDKGDSQRVATSEKERKMRAECRDGRRRRKSDTRQIETAE